MKRRIILCSPIYDFTHKCFTIGGIQTYFRDLASICMSNNIDVVLVMMRDDYKSYEETVCDGISIEKHPAIFKRGKFSIQLVFDKVYDKYNSKNTIFVIDTDQRDIKSKNKNVITIQHGIAFDIPGYMIGGFWGKNKYLQDINKLLRCIKNKNRLSYTSNTVCVDYNYYNWYRTIGTIRTNVTVIPNYSSGKLSFEDFNEKVNNISFPLNVVFARRFVDYRGTIIFKKVVERLYSEGLCFNVTFSGDGPLLSEVKNAFINNPCVKFTTFDAKDSIDFHRNFDIAVVPTIFSEGTSLSLCEAMSAGCIPLATHVGGMTNMLLDGFNGFLCYPDEEDLYLKLKSLLMMDITELKRIANNAYSSAVSSFSKERWGRQWIAYLNNIFEQL